MTPPIRLCEWGRTTRHDLTASERQEIARAAARWQQENRLPQPPLSFTGADGKTLCARQYVGVVEAAGRTVEIYPKLDAHLLDADTVDAAAPLEGVMRSVLWMMDASGFLEAPEADTAPLDEVPTGFLDLFALLLAKNLRAELARGVGRRYERREDDLPAVRGRIDVAAQVRRNRDRMDRLACVWDEFTPDTPVNRLFRCACRHLLRRSRHTATVWLLQDCLLLLDDVADVGPATALEGVRHLRHWDRGTERFRRPFELACRLLRGFGPALEAGADAADTFVFLVDMNCLFEAYAGAALAARFGVAVETQKFLGKLFALDAGGIHQYADFYLRDRTGIVWIGDAKYKHLTRNGRGPVTLDAAVSEEAPSPGAAPRSLSPDDVRQLTVYAELEARRSKSAPAAPRANLILLYPLAGAGAMPAAVQVPAWNGSKFYLVPVRVQPAADLREVLPPFS